MQCRLLTITVFVLVGWLEHVRASFPFPWASSMPDDPPAPPNWVEARVDNFDPKNKLTFKQYYTLIYNGTSSLHVVSIGGEQYNEARAEKRVRLASAEDRGKLKAVDDYPRLTKEIGQRFNATVYGLEHRYYEHSYPVRYPRTADDYKFHSSRQALADLANFIRTKKREIPGPTQWIVVGGSYPGMLALWFRQLYPDLTVGAIGSSAPVEAVVNFTSFMNISQQGYESRHPVCASKLHKGLQVFVQLARRDDAEANARLKKLYPTFRNFTSSAHAREMFIYHVVSDAYTQIQMQIDGICAEWNIKADPLEELARRFGDTADKLNNPNMRSWAWQVCNEFGFFYSPDFPHSYAAGSFSLSKVYLDDCQRHFGPGYTMERVRRLVRETNQFYGGAAHYNGTQVIISNSELDPWSGQGVYQPSLPQGSSVATASVHFIRNGTHCADLHSGNNPDVRAARRIYMKRIAEWLEQEPSAGVWVHAGWTTLTNVLFIYLMLGWM